MKYMQPLIQRCWSVVLRPRLPALGQFATLFIVALMLLWPVPFASNQFFAIWGTSDLVVSHWPMALLIQRTFAQNHHLPLWNPYVSGGLPLAANPLAALFYPPTQLVHFFSLRDYYLVLVTGHLLFAGVGMLLLARWTFGLPRLPALIAAISYMATPKLLAHLGAGHITMLQTVAWYPWLALACWATVRAPRRWGVFFGLCIALTLLAGHPQMAYYGLLMSAGFAAWLLVRHRRQQSWRARGASIAGLVAAAALGLLLAAIYLLPLEELIALSSRQAPLHVGDVFPPMSFLSLLLSQPPAGAGWETMVTPGWGALVLALVATLTCWRKAWPLVLTTVLIAGLALGNASPLYQVAVRVLPELDSLRGVARIWFVALMEISLLAGLGSEMLLRDLLRGIDALARKKRQIKSPLLVIAGLLMVCAVACPLVSMDQAYTHVEAVTPITTPSRLAYTAAQLAGAGRVYDEPGNISQASAVELSLPLADGQDPLLLQSYIAYMQQAGNYTTSDYILRIPYRPAAQPRAQLLGLMNVSLVISQKPLTDPQLHLIEKADGVLIYRNIADKGPAYLVEADPRGNPPALAHLRQVATGVRMLSMTNEQSTFAFSTSTTAYLVIAAVAFPGWTASLDGHPAPIQRIAGVLPAIKVAPGSHTLIYSYQPSSVHNGAILSGSGLLLALAWFLLGNAWRPGQRRRFSRGKTGTPSVALPEESAIPVEV